MTGTSVAVLRRALDSQNSVPCNYCASSSLFAGRPPAIRLLPASGCTTYLVDRRRKSSHLPKSNRPSSSPLLNAISATTRCALFSASAIGQTWTFMDHPQRLRFTCFPSCGKRRPSGRMWRRPSDGSHDPLILLRCACIASRAMISYAHCAFAYCRSGSRLHASKASKLSRLVQECTSENRESESGQMHATRAAWTTFLGRSALRTPSSSLQAGSGTRRRPLVLIPLRQNSSASCAIGHCKDTAGGHRKTSAMRRCSGANGPHNACTIQSSRTVRQSARLNFAQKKGRGHSTIASPASELPRAGLPRPSRPKTRTSAALAAAERRRSLSTYEQPST